jgi:hypothetical protein
MHSIYSNFLYIYIVNNTCYLVYIKRRLQLEELFKINKAEIYYITLDNIIELAVTRPFYYKISITFKPLEDNKSKITILDLGIIIYRDLEKVAAICTLVKKYKDI